MTDFHPDTLVEAFGAFGSFFALGGLLINLLSFFLLTTLELDAKIA